MSGLGSPNRAARRRKAQEDARQNRKANKQNRSTSISGFTIFDAGSGKVMQFDDRERGLSVARAMAVGNDANDSIEYNNALNMAMPTTPDDNGVTNGAGHPLIAYGENRMPAHLFPASKMFTLMPCDAKDYRKLEAIRDMWVGSTYFKPMEAVEFLYSLCEDSGLSRVWEGYMAGEQRYMNRWSRKTAVDTCGKRTSWVPTTADETVEVLEEARAAYQSAYDRQDKSDNNSIHAYANILIARDRATEAMIRVAVSRMHDVRVGIDLEDDFFLTLDSGNTNITCTAAGYLAACEVLRSHGIGCAPWAQWD